MIAPAQETVDLHRRPVLAGQDRDVAHAAAADASLPRDVDARLLGIDRIEGHLPPWYVRAASPEPAPEACRGPSLGAA